MEGAHLRWISEAEQDILETGWGKDEEESPGWSVCQFAREKAMEMIREKVGGEFKEKDWNSFGTDFQGVILT